MNNPLDKLATCIKTETTILLVVGELVIVIVLTKPIVSLLHVQPKQLVHFGAYSVNRDNRPTTSLIATAHTIMTAAQTFRSTS